MKNVVLLFLLFLVKEALAQGNVSNSVSSSVIIHKDPRIDMLVDKQANINVAVKKANGYTMQGYRLLIVNTSNRNEAIEAKTKVYTNFPQLKAYLLYQTPYFKLKAGNFKTRDEAEKYQKKMNAIFTKGVYIIPETIEIKPDKDALDE
jgi:hypothetical protein